MQTISCGLSFAVPVLPTKTRCREVVRTDQTYENQQKYLLFDTGRSCTWQEGALGLSRPIFVLQQWQRSHGVSLHPPPAVEVTARVCTHQEARGIIQEAAKPAHEAPFQKGGVFWGQLIRFVGDSRRAETLPCCGREGPKE